MIDREKVIKGLECCIGYGIEDTPGCEDCPYNDMGNTCECMRPLYEDVLALLKAQEPVVPIRMNHDENKYRGHYRCPICDDDLTYEQQYCSECGQAVKWDG